MACFAPLEGGVSTTSMTLAPRTPGAGTPSTRHGRRVQACAHPITGDGEAGRPGLRPWARRPKDRSSYSPSDRYGQGRVGAFTAEIQSAPARLILRPWTIRSETAPTAASYRGSPLVFAAEPILPPVPTRGVPAFPEAGRHRPLEGRLPRISPARSRPRWDARMRRRPCSAALRFRALGVDLRRWSASPWRRAQGSGVDRGLQTRPRPSERRR